MSAKIRKHNQNNLKKSLIGGEFMFLGLKNGKIKIYSSLFEYWGVKWKK